MKPIAVLLLAFAGPLWAQSGDPTRPPAAWLLPMDESKAAGGATGGLRLQSVLLPQGRRPVAVISGQTVPVGGSVGGATLVRLNEREAVLKGADGVTHLYLTPDVEKQMIEMPKARQKGKSGPVKGLP